MYTILAFLSVIGLNVYNFGLPERNLVKIYFHRTA